MFGSNNIQENNDEEEYDPPQSPTMVSPNLTPISVEQTSTISTKQQSTISALQKSTISTKQKSTFSARQKSTISTQQTSTLWELMAFLFFKRYLYNLSNFEMFTKK